MYLRYSFPLNRETIYMAGVDKIFGTVKQFYELKAWLDRCPVEGQHLKMNLYYPPKIAKGTDEMVIANFTTAQDVWLIQNCPIDWMQERLQQQYGFGYEAIKNGKTYEEAYKDFPKAHEPLPKSTNRR